MAQNPWYKLDIVGKFYSSQGGNAAQTVFRFTTTVIDEIDPELLQRALDKTVAAFPNFNVCLRSGLFWHYLEQAPDEPKVSEENTPVCFGLYADSKSVLFRVSYYHDRINLEVSHMVADGRGTLNFFKSLVYTYLEERYGIDPIAREYDGTDFQKSEDSFNKYFERHNKTSLRAPKVYHLQGWHDAADPAFLEYHIPVKPVLAQSKQMGVSMTAFIVAVVIYAIRAEMPKRQRNRAIRMDVPVDLRQFFESSTTKNFFGLAYVSYTPGPEDEPIEEIAKQVHEQIKSGAQGDALLARVNGLTAISKNPALRFAPVFFKDFVMNIAEHIESRQTTTTVSNLSKISVAPEAEPYLTDLSVMTSSKGMNFLLCSFKDSLNICITTAYSNPNVVKNFCRYFSDLGLEGHININKFDGRGNDATL